MTRMGTGTPNTGYTLVNGTGWIDKSGKSRHADVVEGSPSFVPNVFDGKGVVRFSTGATDDCRAYNSNSLESHTEKFSIFLLSRDLGTTASVAHVNHYNSYNWGFGARKGHINNIAYFNGYLYPAVEDTDSRDNVNFHLYQATLDDQDNGNVWLDENKVLTNGSGLRWDRP